MVAARVCHACLVSNPSVVNHSCGRCLLLTAGILPLLLLLGPFLPPQEEESLAHMLKCFENTPQASQVKLVAQKASWGGGANMLAQPGRKQAWEWQPLPANRCAIGRRCQQTGAPRLRLLAAANL